MLTVERIAELERSIGCEFDEELTLDGVTARALLAAARRSLELVARDADVRTLDEWAERNGASGLSAYRTKPGEWVLWTPARARYPLGPFTGATPDEARAKAAAWVREQSKVVSGG